jgi:hypothetical protein
MRAQAWLGDSLYRLAVALATFVVADSPQLFQALTRLP